MRPLKLVMQAFGSYGNRTEIDFEKPDQNLFLITGNTGSGKTTIFDAIVLLSTEKPAPMQIRKTVRNFRVSLWRSGRSRLSP